MDIVREYQYYISSKQRDSGESNSFNIRVFPPITLFKSTNVFKVTVLNAIIPCSFSQVNATNNLFYIEFDSVVYPITIAEGNYNIADLNIAVRNGIIAAVSSVRNITFDISYSLSSGKNTFTYLTCDGTPINTLKLFSSSTIGKMLGLNQDLDLTLTIPSMGQQKFNVNPLFSIYIRSSTLTQSSAFGFNIESLLEKSVQSDILTEIMINVNPGTYLQYTNSTNQGVYVSNKTIDNIELYLSSQDDYVLSLGNLDWSCCLLIQEIQPKIYESDVLVPSVEQIIARQQNVENKVKEKEEEKDKLLNELENLIKKK
jgi:hypothetical protein